MQDFNKLFYQTPTLPLDQPHSYLQRSQQQQQSQQFINSPTFAQSAKTLPRRQDSGDYSIYGISNTNYFANMTKHQQNPFQVQMMQKQQNIQQKQQNNISSSSYSYNSQSRGSNRRDVDLIYSNKNASNSKNNISRSDNSNFQQQNSANSIQPNNSNSSQLSSNPFMRDEYSGINQKYSERNSINNLKQTVVYTIIDLKSEIETTNHIKSHIDLQNPILAQQDHIKRGRTLEDQQLKSQTQSSSTNHKKRNVLVIKKESINRQNSFSRSPTNASTKHLGPMQISELNNLHEVSMGSPYQSPMATDHDQFNYQFMSTDVKSQATIYSKNHQSSNLNSSAKSKQQHDLSHLNFETANSTAVKTQSNQQKSQNQNSVIIRKTVGELKRDQNSIFYFDSNLMKSSGPMIQQQRQIEHIQFNTQNQKREIIGQIKKFEGNGRNSLTSNYQQFIQKSDIKSQSILSKTFDKDPALKKQKIPQSFDLDQKLNIKFNENQIIRESLISEQLNQSSESDDDDLESAQRKIIIQKNKVNFKKACSSDEIGIKDSEDDEQKSRSKSLRSNQFDDLILPNQSNGIYRVRKSLLNPDQSKLEFDRLLQSSNLGNFSQSPECLRRQRSDNLIGVQSFNKKSQLNHERSQNHLSLNTQNKLEVPKVLKALPSSGFNELLKSPNTTSYQSQLKETEKNIQKKPQKQSPSKKINLNIGFKQSEHSRVSQSLLLDNFLSKSKDRQSSQNQKVVEFPLTVTHIIQNEKIILNEKAKAKVSQIAPKDIEMENQLDSLIKSLNRLIDENRCNSPIRASQFIVDVDYMKALAEERLTKPGSNSSRGNYNERLNELSDEVNSDNQGPIEVYVPDNINFKNNSLQLSTSMIHTSNSNNAILSLSQVTKEKFKEVIDNLYVPTPSVFKKKTKEREFRRPTQNPPRRSKSQQRNGLNGNSGITTSSKASARIQQQMQIIQNSLQSGGSLHRDMIEDKIRNQHRMPEKQKQFNANQSQSTSTALSSDVEIKI
eukprot:403332216